MFHRPRNYVIAYAIAAAVSVAQVGAQQFDPEHYSYGPSSFNEKGFERSSALRVANEAEAVSVFNGNLSVPYVLFSVPLKSGTHVTISLNYNGSTLYNTRPELSTDLNPLAPVVAGGWFFGVNGWGVQALNFETHLHNRWGEDRTVSSDDELAFHIAGHDYYCPQFARRGQGSNGPIQLLRADGATRTFLAGQYIHWPPLTDADGFSLLAAHPSDKAKARMSAAPDGPYELIRDFADRDLFVYEAGGTVVRFHEQVHKWAGIEDLTVEKLGIWRTVRHPVSMLLQDITLPTGDVIYIEYWNLHNGAVGRDFIKAVHVPSAGVTYDFNVHRYEQQEMFVAESTCDFTFVEGRPVPENKVEQRRYTFAVSYQENKVPRYAIGSMTNPASETTVFGYEDYTRHIDAMRTHCVRWHGEECEQTGTWNERINAQARRLKTITYPEGGRTTYTYMNVSAYEGMSEYAFNVRNSQNLAGETLIREASPECRSLGREPQTSNIVKQRDVFIPDGSGEKLVMSESYVYTCDPLGSDFRYNHIANKFTTSVTTSPGTDDPSPARTTEYHFRQRQHDSHYTPGNEPVFDEDWPWDFLQVGVRAHDDNEDGIVQDALTLTDYFDHSLERKEVISGVTGAGTRGTWAFVEGDLIDKVKWEYTLATDQQDPEQVNFSQVKQFDAYDAGSDVFKRISTSIAHTGYMKLPGIDSTPATQPYRPGLNTMSEVRNNAGTLLAKSETVFDESPGAPWSLAAIESRTYTSETNFVSTHMTYSAPGQLVQTVGPEGETTVLGYADVSVPARYVSPTGEGTQTVTLVGDGRFPTSTTFKNPGGIDLVVYQMHNYRGQVERSIDQNGVISELEYDAVGRASRVFGPGDFASVGVKGTPSAEWVYPSPNETRVKTFVDESLFMEAVNHFDGLGRHVATDEISTAGNSIRVLSQDLDWGHRVVRAVDADGVWTETDYDGQGRVTRTRMPGKNETLVDEQSFQYEVVSAPVGLLVSDYQPNMFQKVTTTDELDRQVVTYSSGDQTWQTVQPDLSMVTNIGYNLKGFKTKTQTPEGYETTYDYDFLGRVTQVRRPEWGGNTPWRKTLTLPVIADTHEDPTHGTRDYLALNKGETLPPECGPKPQIIECEDGPGYIQPSVLDPLPRTDGFLILDANAAEVPPTNVLQLFDVQATLHVYVTGDGHEDADGEIGVYAYTADWVEGTMWDDAPPAEGVPVTWRPLPTERGWTTIDVSDQIAHLLKNADDRTPGLRLVLVNNSLEYPASMTLSSRETANTPYLELRLEHSETPQIFDNTVVRSWYDDSGRPVFAQAPHNAASVLGEHYTYTAYDALGRVKEIGALKFAGADPTLASPEDRVPLYTYTYDHSITNGKGRIRSMSAADETWSETLDYDANGNTVARDIAVHVEDTHLPSKRFEYAFTKNGLLRQMTYPDFVDENYQAIYYTYNSRQQLQKVGVGHPNGTIVDDDFYAIYTYTPAGKLRVTSLGNPQDQVGSAQVLLYSYNNRGLLESIGSPLDPMDRSRSFYEHIDWYGDNDHTAGNIMGMTLQVRSALGDQLEIHELNWSSLEYDAANRLTSAVGALDGQGVQAHYDYDLDGNITYLQRIRGDDWSQVLDYAYDTTLNRLDSIGLIESGIIQGSFDYDYDSSGSVSGDEFRNVQDATYDALGRLISFTGGERSHLQVRYYYDGHGNRIAKVVEQPEGEEPGPIFVPPAVESGRFGG